MPNQPHTVSTATFAAIGQVLCCNSPGLGVLTGLRRFRALFGFSPLIFSLLWSLLAPKCPPRSRPVHLLWALMFLKVYGSEQTHRVIANVDEKTFRKWTWFFISLLADLDVVRVLHFNCISYEFTPLFPSPNHHVTCLTETEDKMAVKNTPGDNRECEVSVDGTDFRIYEPTPFSPKRCSHKFKGPGLRYEVAICISTGHIVWVFGPFPCGLFSDLTIFRLRMKQCLLPDEMVVGDGGYKDEAVLLKLDVEGTYRKELADIRARQETVNRRFKQFFGHRFRHKLSLHSICFHAVANITQIMIEHVYPLFEINY